MGSLRWRMDYYERLMSRYKRSHSLLYNSVLPQKWEGDKKRIWYSDSSLNKKDPGCKVFDAFHQNKKIDRNNYGPFLYEFVRLHQHPQWLLQ